MILPAIKKIRFEGYSGKVALNDAGDRAMRSLIQNWQTSDEIGALVDVAIYDPSNEALTEVDGQLQKSCGVAKDSQVPKMHPLLRITFIMKRTESDA